MEIINTTKRLRYMGRTYAVTFGGDDGNKIVVVRCGTSERLLEMRPGRHKRGSNEAAKQAVLCFCEILKEEHQRVLEKCSRT